MAEIKIKNLKLRAIVGIQDWEREKKQDILLNISFEYDSSEAELSDDISDTVDYKAMKQKIIALVEKSNYNLLEKLAAEVLKICLDTPGVTKASVEIDKPHALRFADSVSVTVSR